MVRPDEGFFKHWCPVCKTEYCCQAAMSEGGCDDEDFERTCLDCLGIQLGVDFYAHVRIKDVKSNAPIKDEVNA